jgi:hypothetical protein
LVDVAREGHVDLHELWLEQRETREPGIPRTKVVDRNAEAEPAYRRHALLHIIQPTEGGPLRDLEHAPLGDRGER